MRCAAIKVEYTPYFQNDPSSNFAYVPCESFYDKDGSSFTPFAAWPSYPALVQTPRRKTYNLARPWKRFVKSFKYPIVTKYPIAEPTNPAAAGNPAGLWHYSKNGIGSFDSANSTHVGFFVDGSTASKTIGKVIITAYFVYRDIDTSAE